ncbi:MAG: F0F1 ATP synthase subunit gamma [Actinomycetota bacterium]|nr:F0F1 ATP synthase subunit gamma [Actinomycetota bacterium]
MAGGQERILRRRIRSVQSTKKITRAMELIAASRIVRAQQAIAAARPYVEKMAEVVGHLADTPDGRQHPLFREPQQTRRAAVIVIAGDRGLSGAYNSSVLRAAERRIQELEAIGADVALVAVGRKVSSHFRYRGRRPASAFTGIADRPVPDDAKAVADVVMGSYAAGELDRIDVIYTHFESVGRQAVTSRMLVPIEAQRSEAGTGRDASAGLHADRSAARFVDYEYEPGPAELLDLLLPSWLQGEILAAMLSASASEYVARQRAMKAATDNAEDLITTLTRVMNRARQDAITTEIMEIVGGAEALRADSDDSGTSIETYEDPDAA